MANKGSNPNNLGDEPFMFYKQNQRIRVAVCNSRREGMSRLIESINKNLKNIFILDDVYQHRWVKPNTMILLTEYTKPYFKDYLFPSGNLRESRKSAHRADIIVVTKCPSELSIEDREKFISELNIGLKQKVFFTKIKYNQYIFGKKKKLYLKGKNVVGVDIKPDIPKKPHITIKNNFDRSLSKISDELILKLNKFI